MLGEDRQHRTRIRARQRVVLEVVNFSDATGLAILPGKDGSVLLRGQGDTDYVCGRCGQLLAIGIRRGMLQRFVFACNCGA